MVSVSLRQNPSSATDQNTSATVLRPVSGTPLWARNDHAPDALRPASPWDEWTIPPKPAALAEPRKPSPHATEPTGRAEPSTTAKARVTARAAVTAVIPAATANPTATGSPAPSVPFRPWRIDFARPDVVEYPELPQPESSTITKRLVLLLGLAYLFIAALASGLAYTGYFATASTGDNDEPEPGPGPEGRSPEGEGPEHSEEAPAPPLPSPRPPSRHPDAPGLHTRPDGSRYLVMPLPADLADRFRAHTTATATPAMIGGGAL